MITTLRLSPSHLHAPPLSLPRRHTSALHPLLMKEEAEEAAAGSTTELRGLELPPSQAAEMAWGDQYGAAAAAVSHPFPAPQPTVIWLSLGAAWAR